MNKIGSIYLAALLASAAVAAVAATQPVRLSHSFEFRYVDDRPAANGETDFSGETAVFDTDQRIEFLTQYAKYAVGFFDDAQLNKEVATKTEVDSFLKNLKPQPLPEIRTKILPQQWKWLGYKKDQRQQQIKTLSIWNDIKGVKVENAHLIFTSRQVSFKRSFQPQAWRFFIQYKVRTPRNDIKQSFCLSDNETAAATVGFGKNGRFLLIVGRIVGLRCSEKRGSD